MVPLAMEGASQGTTPVESPGVVEPTMAGGHEMVGGVMSCSVTEKKHELERPAASVAVHCTCVSPKVKLEPEGTEHEVLTTATLSVAEKRYGIGLTLLVLSNWYTRGSELLVGQVATGGWLSLTVMVKLHEARLLEGSVAVQVTTVLPTG